MVLILIQYDKVRYQNKAKIYRAAYKGLKPYHSSQRMDGLVVFQDMLQT